MITVFGVDPGLAKMGLIVAELGGPCLLNVVHGLLITTEKGSKKKNASYSSDCIRRSRELSCVVETLCLKYKPRAIFMESVSLPRNASAVFKIGLAFGTALSYAERFDLPVLTSTPMELKLALTSKKGASKKEMVDSFTESVDISAMIRPNGRQVPTGSLEHLADAYAAILAGLHTDVGRMLLTAIKIEGS